MTMRTLALALQVLLFATAGFAQQPASPVAGSWEGALEVGAVKLRIGVAITVQPDGKLSATMDSPDQGAYGLALSDVTFADGVLKFSLRIASGSFEGRLNDAGTEIAGAWTQGGMVPLVLKKVEKLTRLNRPQAPTPPFPYRLEEVTITNATGPAVLSGTLTVPEGKGPFPAVVLITGSGPQNRDEEIFGHKPFLVLADHLTRRGIAVLRYDDRGVGKSTGNVASATSEDFAGDAWAAWQTLSARPEIDPRRVGLLGHSEGGLIAPMVAASHREIAFVVMLAGTGVTGEQVMLRQAAAIMRASGASDDAIAANTALQQQVFAILREEKTTPRIVERLQAIPVPGAKEASAALVKQSSSPWFRFFATYDPAPALTKVRCPVLAIAGELDLQVLPGQNLPAIGAALTQGGNQHHTVLELPGLNHLFQSARTGLPAEYGQIEETMAPAALDAITTWIRARTGLAKSLASAPTSAGGRRPRPAWTG
jgi:pimeloyl-ACP methyl ester carboxylesterase